jgi:serine/threonine protein kinase
VVALKVMSRSVARCRPEAAIPARGPDHALNHPGIVTVFDDDAGLDYIAMSTSRADPRRPMPPGLPVELALRLVRQVADALAAAHRSIVHRDPPSNIMLASADHEGRRLGLAKLTEAAPTRRRYATRAELSGYGAYMSPEQISGRAVDAQRHLQPGTILRALLGGGRRREQRNVHAGGDPVRAPAPLAGVSPTSRGL